MIVQLVAAMSCALVISALCSIFEATLYSTPDSHIEVLSQQGRKSGRILKKLKSDIHKPIAAILTLNTVANTMGAAIAGSAAAALFGPQYLLLFSICFTLAILIFSEILPKTAGVAYARRAGALDRPAAQRLGHYFHPDYPVLQGGNQDYPEDAA